MNVILVGNFLSAKSGKSKDGEQYYSVSILTGDDTARISFDNTKEAVDMFRELSTSKRLADVSVPVEMNIYNGNAYFRYTSMI